uniref:Macaca fascicularis brain cDNA clone: QtrA-15630, similar to human KIAA0256 gene product (KIAA0256), mRNA, RefSeq: NM_014701.1 n=1 Tax=Macaca fascicularis TaxID=9541 RepID=I7GEK4_MACFA|nr:unnamed protein product [Macaca fascicularis]
MFGKCSRICSTSSASKSKAPSPFYETGHLERTTQELVKAMLPF